MQLFAIIVSNALPMRPNVLDSFFYLGYVLKDKSLKKEVHYA
jgi:hypothetical protein